MTALLSNGRLIIEADTILKIIPRPRHDRNVIRINEEFKLIPRTTIRLRFREKLCGIPKITRSKRTRIRSRSGRKKAGWIFVRTTLHRAHLRGRTLDRHVRHQGGGPAPAALAQFQLRGCLRAERSRECGWSAELDDAAGEGAGGGGVEEDLRSYGQCY